MADSRESSAARFSVSDAVAVPLRGYQLRLKVMDGKPRLSDIKGGRLRLTSPDGDERVVDVIDFASMGGRGRQERLDRYGLLEVMIAGPDAVRDGRPVGPGWTATTERS